MKNFKKILAFLCSATMIVSASATAFAAPPSQTAGTGNMLAYSTESVVVPTSIKVALNPAEYTVTVRPDATDSTKTTTAQIVTFNYGIANKSTANKIVNVEFRVSGTPDSDKTPITFVDSAALASEKTTQNPTGAEAGELKMYLAVIGSTAAPKTAGDEDFEVTVVEDGANTENATAANLVDVKMSNASSGSVVFAPKGDYYAFAETAFSLGKATYDVQDNQSIDFDTTQEALASKMEMTELGDVTGFTIIGAMNKNADWTKADVSSLSFAPIYDISKDATGNETAAGGYKQVKTGYTVTFNANYGADPATATEEVASGAHPTGATTAVAALKTGNDGYTFAGWGTSATATEEVDLDTISAATTLYAIWEENAPTTYTVTYNANYGASPATATETVEVGSHPTGESTAVTALKTGNDGYTFVGWGASATATEEVDLDTISAATTLYAIWEENAPTEITGQFRSSDNKYVLNMDEGIINQASDVEEFKVDGNAVTMDLEFNASFTKVMITKATLKSAMGTEAWGATGDNLVFTFKVGSTTYKATVSKN